MSTSQRQSGSMGEELTNAALIGLIALFLLTLVLRATGSVAAFLTGARQPTASWAAGAGLLFNPGTPAEALAAPGLHSVAYWVTTVVVLGGL
ncbi:type VI secretion protein, partial [Burkholderia multivorans]